jgi:hypothetical protein
LLLCPNAQFHLDIILVLSIFVYKKMSCWQPHAEALGHFVGSIYAASAQITKDQAEQAEYATAIIKSALTVVDKSKIGGPATGTAASVAKEYVSLAMKAALMTQDLSTAQMWEKASIPIHSDETDKLALPDFVQSYDRDPFGSKQFHAFKKASDSLWDQLQAQYQSRWRLVVTKALTTPTAIP